MDKLGIEPISSRKKDFISLSPTLCFCTEQKSFYGESFFRKTLNFAQSTLGAGTKPSSRRLPNCHCLAHGAETESNPCRRFSLCPCFTLRMASHARLFKTFTDDLKKLFTSFVFFRHICPLKISGFKRKNFLLRFQCRRILLFPICGKFF